MKNTKIVFLFPTIKKGASPAFFFTFSNQSLTLHQKLLHPFAKQYSRLEWDSEDVIKLVNNIFPSTLMRSLMQAEIVARFAPPGYEVLSTNVPHISGSVVVLSKFLMNKRPLLHYLKLRGNVVLADMVDGRFKLDRRLRLVDGLICCSYKGREFYQSEQNRVPVFFVEHCIDTRLPAVSQFPSVFSPRYFGAPQNLYAFDTLEQFIGITYTEYEKKPARDWYKDLPLANFHYAVRKPCDKPSFKPFTKGMIAARCNANILVHKDDGDALCYLGKDYPYLIQDELSPETVKHFLAQAKKDFGTERWRQGLSVMQKIRERSSEEALAGQFWTMIKEMEGA